MDQASEHEFSTGQIFEPPALADHPRGCLCTGCTTERQLERGGRYDSHVASYLHHIRDLREVRVPRSAGVGEYMAAKAAVAEAQQDSESPADMSLPSTPEKDAA